MKKNKTLRLASLLLVLVLLTTSIIGGTFAKYTTSASASDTARVAKWGVDFTATTDLFATSYTDTGATGGTITVLSSDNTTKLVAPGTTGKGLSVTNSAAEPEVSYSVTIKLDPDTAKMPSLTYTPTDGTATTYEPVKFNVYNGTTKLNTAALTLDGLTDLFNGAKIIYKYDVNTKQYTVDSNLDGSFNSETASNAEPNIKVEWIWDFETATEANKALYDELDTILGNTAASVTPAITTYSNGTISGINTEVTLNWIITATQIN